MQTEKVHISIIRAGDTIFHDGKDMTVCKKDIKYDSFMGISIFGDSYRIGTIPVLRVLF
jgi:hypothetical protein